MKNIIIVFFAIIMFSCSKEKRMIDRSELIGQWKEIQRKNTKTGSLRDISGCEGKIEASTYTFKADNICITKNYCDNSEPEKKGTWMYRDNVLSIVNGDMNLKYSVSDAGDNKIRLLIVTAEVNGFSSVDWDMMEVYSILEKQ